MTSLRYRELAFRRSPPDEDHLRLVLENVLSFAVTNLDRLEANSQYWPADADSDSFIRLIDKVLIETALLALLASRVHALARAASNSLTALVEQLSRKGRGDRARVMLLRFPQPAAALAIPHFVLERLGSYDASFGDLARRAISSQQLLASERPPFRAMDVLWSRNLAAHREQPPDFASVLSHSILARRPHPIYMTRVDAYALTHGLMYTTDFGTCSLPRSLDDKALASIIDACLAWHIASEDLDLLGELLLCVALVRGAWSPYAGFGWHVLSETWAELGFVPGPSFEPTHFSGLRGDQATAYAFRHVYHSTYVTGMLAAVFITASNSGWDSTSGWLLHRAVDARTFDSCALAARRGFAFSARRKPNRGRSTVTADSTRVTQASWAFATPPSRADEVLERVSAAMEQCDLRTGKAQNRQWLRALLSAPLDTEAKALVVSDSLLIQCARHYELILLGSALGDLVGMGMPPTSTFVEAANFLARQQLPSGAIGAHFVNSANHESPEARACTRYLSGCLRQVADYLTG